MKTLLGLLALLCCSVAQAVTLDELQQRFSQQVVIRAEFVQLRAIKGMVKPLRSSGELLISRDKGLWWQQQKPFPLTMVMEDTRMVQIMSGQKPQIITAQSHPQMFQFNHLLRALFQADRKVLEKNFSMTLNDVAAKRWELILVPTTTPLDKLFNTITLQGGTYLDTIRLDDRQGDKTDITFTRQRLEPATLTDDEQQYFVF